LRGADRRGPITEYTTACKKGLGPYPVSEAVQTEAVATVSPQTNAGPSSSDEPYRPGSSRPADAELYAFRTVIAQRQEEERAAQPQKPKVNIVALLALIIIVSAVAALLVIAIPMLNKQKPKDLFIDLGTQRYNPAGLGGRLIVQWTDGASYKFTVDPLETKHVPAFQATISNPPHAITFSLVMRDATQGVICSKDLVIPGVPEGAGAFDQSDALTARIIPTGDTWQNVAGDKGQINEMVLSGSLSCSLDAYKKIVAWDFKTDFPPLATQKDWAKHEEAVQVQAKKTSSPAKAAPTTYAGYALIKSIPASIEADDVIVSDNPDKGVVVTSEGHAFLVGSEVLVNPALDWQTFPAEIHYHCDKTATCMLTRITSRTAVRARMLK
jgi:hypothetical protein